MKIPTNQPTPTPRTEFWKESLEDKTLTKEKISEIFQKTIDYFEETKEKTDKTD